MMRALLLSLAVLMNTTAQPNNIPSNARSAQAEARVQAALTAELKAMGADWGAPLYLRIFKASDELEVWVATGERYQHLRTWPICTWSGDLGPKLSQGDGQAPEGFYEVAAQQLNPASRFHLSFNLGYPNAYDRAHGRTGDFLMVHGNCVSVGCYAMGDAAIEEIYTLVAAALTHGQRAVPVHAFPFRMDGDWEAQHAESEWLPFWRQLAAGYRAFGQTGQPPRVRVVEGEYRLREG
jgi:murein L,D-transpeptidase YafK